MTRRALAALGSYILIALILLCVAWELWLAPLRPGGSWLVLKVTPLLFPLLGVLNGRRYTFQWSSMLILVYMAEGIVRAISEEGLSVRLATIEIALCAMFYVSAITYARIPAPKTKLAKAMSSDAL